MSTKLIFGGEEYPFISNLLETIMKKKIFIENQNGNTPILSFVKSHIEHPLSWLHMHSLRRTSFMQILIL